MQNRKILEFRIGFFVLLGVAALFIFIISQGQIARTKGYEIKVAFNYVGGVEVGSPVRVSGVRVGEVKNVSILYEVAPKVVLTLKLKQDIKISRYSQVTIRTLGIIGEKYVEITPSPEKEFLGRGDMIEGVDPFPLERFGNMAEDIVRNLNRVLVDVGKILGAGDTQKNLGNILANTNQTVLKASAFMEKVTELTVSINKTNQELKETVMASRPKIETMLSRIENLAEASQAMVVTAKNKLEDFGETGEEFKKTAVEIRTFFEDLENKGLVARIMQEEELLDNIKQEIALLQTATKQFQASADKFGALSDNLDSVVTQVKAGRGTVGKLLTSDEIYQEVLGFIKDIRLHPWRLFMRK